MIKYTDCVNVDAIGISKNFRYFAIIIQNPCGHVHKIDHKTGNMTLNDGSIPPQNVLVHNINRIALRYNCSQ